MTGLVQTKPTTTGQANGGGNSPTGLRNRSSLHTLAVQILNRRRQIAAHEVKDGARKIVFGMALDEVAIAGVNAQFGRRHGEDQPAFAGIDRREPEYVAKESAIRIGIATVEEKMCSVDHGRDCTPTARSRPLMAIEQDGLF